VGQRESRAQYAHPQPALAKKSAVDMQQLPHKILNKGQSPENPTNKVVIPVLC